jgi:hypothetical protein
MAAEDTLALVLARANAHAFDEATTLLERTLEEAAREGGASVRSVAQELARLTPLFGHTDVYQLALPFYETALRSLTPLLPFGDSTLVRNKQNLAVVLGCAGRADAAFNLQRQLLDELVKTRPPDDADQMRARNEVARGLRVRGDDASADALFAELEICEHLRPLRDELLRGGAHIHDAGQLWSSGCRLWLYFDVVLEPDALLRRLGLDACVVIVENEDPRSGPEVGLVCKTHHDGIVGPHPRFNPQTRVIR